MLPTSIIHDEQSPEVLQKEVRSASQQRNVAQHAHALEQEVTVEDSQLIQKWLIRGGSFRALRLLLNGVRGIDDSSDYEDEDATPPPPPRRDCCVCNESLGMESFQKTATSCQHEPSSCRQCLTRHIDTQIPEMAWDQVSCPECPETLGFGAVKEFASEATFEM